MTTLDDLPFDVDSPATPTGAAGKRPCARHSWELHHDADAAWTACARCGKLADPVSRRRGRTNRARGNRAELDVARSIPGGRKMGPLGLPWDVEVAEYARLQVKKLIHPPSPAEIAHLIAAIPDTGDRLRGFVWVEAAGQGKRGQRVAWFLWTEWQEWHGATLASLAAAPFYVYVKRGTVREPVALVTMPLDEWVAEFVA